jgi:hypothetical protein
MAFLLADVLDKCRHDESEARRRFAWGVYKFVHEPRAPSRPPSLWELRHRWPVYGPPPGDFRAPQNPDAYADWIWVPVVPSVPMITSAPSRSERSRSDASVTDRKPDQIDQGSARVLRSVFRGSEVSIIDPF